MHIREILDKRRIILDLSGGSKREVLHALVEPVCATHGELDPDALLEVLVRREETSTTAIADGIAIPHGKMQIGEEVICAFGRSEAGIDFQSVDGKPTHIFFLLVSPEDHPSLHLRWLAHLAVLLKSSEFRKGLLSAGSAEELLAVIDAEEDARAADSPGETG